MRMSNANVQCDPMSNANVQCECPLILPIMRMWYWFMLFLSIPKPVFKEGENAPINAIIAPLTRRQQISKILLSQICNQSKSIHCATSYRHRALCHPILTFGVWNYVCKSRFTKYNFWHPKHRRFVLFVLRKVVRPHVPYTCLRSRVDQYLFVSDRFLGMRLDPLFVCYPIFASFISSRMEYHLTLLFSARCQQFEDLVKVVIRQPRRQPM